MVRICRSSLKDSMHCVGVSGVNGHLGLGLGFLALLSYTSYLAPKP